MNRTRGYYSIEDFGAVKNPGIINTKPIQNAIDECARAGGGRVIVPSGEFTTGTIYLKDHVELRLMSGAVLKGSSNLSDYNPDNCFEQNPVFTQENVTGAHLLIAHEVRNVSITGNGTIDGNSSAFFGEPLKNGWNYSIKEKRPGQMIYFCECEHVLVEGVSLNNSPYWTLYIHGCANVCVKGLSISNPPRTQNGDGVDIDCSKNVVISDCVIFSGDDSITLRGYNEKLKDKTKCCENVVISNCILSTPCNAIRVGVGDGIVRNCAISNIVMTNTRTGICLISKYSDRQKQGTTIENIRFSNLVMDTVMPFDVAAGLDAESKIKNIYFSNIRATSSKTSCVYGNENVMLENIKFNDLDLEISGGREWMQDEISNPYSHADWAKGINTAFFCGRCDDLTFQNVRVKWSELTAPWKHSFIFKDSGRIQMRNVDAETPPNQNTETNIKSENVERLEQSP